MFPHLKLLSGHILFSLLSVSAQRKRRGHGGNNYCGFKRTFHLAGSSSFVICSFGGGTVRSALVCGRERFGGSRSLRVSSRSVESRDQSKAKMSKGRRARERVLSSLRCLFLHICYALEGMQQGSVTSCAPSKAVELWPEDKTQRQIWWRDTLVERWGVGARTAHSLPRDVDGKHRH